MVHPVAQSVGMALVNLVYSDIYAKAVCDFLLWIIVLWCEDDAYGKDVVNLVKGDMLVLHLVPYRIRTLDAGFYLVFDTHLVQFGTDGVSEVLEQLVALLLCRCQLGLYGVVCLRVLVSEAQVFQLGLYLVQSESVGKRSVYIQSLTSDLVLLVGRLRLQGTHVVQSVAYLDEYHAYVVAHGEQQLLEVLCLC